LTRTVEVAGAVVGGIQPRLAPDACSMMIVAVMAITSLVCSRPVLCSLAGDPDGPNLRPVLAAPSPSPVRG